MDQVWGNRAASAEAAVAKRHLRRLWQLPGTQLGVVAWPATSKQLMYGTWHYWWQAHLLDCLVDAQVRDPQPDRRLRIERQIRAHRLRNTGWVNDYYDDMAWLALALERAGRLAGVEQPKALHTLAEQFLNAWVPEDGGGIPWRKQDQFFNAPANGPAAIFLARYDDRHPAGPADGRLDRRDPDRPGDPPGVRRRQGRIAGPRAVHLLPGRGPRPRGRVGGQDPGSRSRDCACIAWSPRSATTWRPTASSRVRVAVTVGCSTASRRATSRSPPPRCRRTPRRTPRRAPPPRSWCCPRRDRRGTTGRPSTGCRCSGRSGTAAPTCRRSVARRPSSSRARSMRRRCPNGTCRCSCPGGC